MRAPGRERTPGGGVLYNPNMPAFAFTRQPDALAWFGSERGGPILASEHARISQALTQRVKELADRYDTPMPQMASRVAELEARVNRHLEKMGFVWN